MKTTTLVAIPLLAAGSAHAATLVTYVPSGTAASSPNNAPVVGTGIHPLVTASNIGNIAAAGTGNQLSSGSSGPIRTANGTWTFGTDGWLASNLADDGTDGTASSTSNYFNITLSTPGSETLTLNNLSFNFGAGFNSGVASLTSNFYYAVFASVDNGAFNQIGSTFDSGSIALTQNATQSFGTQNIDLSSITGANSVELRVWVGSTNASPSAGTIFQNITVTGEAVPEPGVAVLGGLSLLGLLRRRRA